MNFHVSQPIHECHPSPLTSTNVLAWNCTSPLFSNPHSTDQLVFCIWFYHNPLCFGSITRTGCLTLSLLCVVAIFVSVFVHLVLVLCVILFHPCLFGLVLSFCLYFYMNWLIVFMHILAWHLLTMFTPLFGSGSAVDWHFMSHFQAHSRQVKRFPCCHTFQSFLLFWL